jgi:hypothetical protein
LPEAVPDVGGDGQSLDEAGARDLTERIRHATRQVCMLLLEAHTRRAWAALGYQTWEQYVQTEFGFSRSRSYQLLDQGRFILAIKSCAGVSGLLDINPYAAAQLKPHLAEIIEIVRVKTEGRSEDEAREIVTEVIEVQRSAIAGRRSKQADQPSTEQRDWLQSLNQAVCALASMPSPSQAAALVAYGQAQNLNQLRSALRWLTEFTDECARQEMV